MSLNEADTRAKLIDPAIHERGWTEDTIHREKTLGAIEIVHGRGRRRATGRMDYVMRIRLRPDTQPVAVALIEAKKESLPPGHGLDQAKGYAEAARHNVQFVFSSNGHLFVEFDRATGLTSEPRPLADFPTPDDLRARYEHNVGFSLDAPPARPLLIPYPGGEGERRYFQDAAIRAVLEKIARCTLIGQPPRALLSLATGTGKTYIAAHLLKRIADAGQLGRALFVCDRNELRTNGLKEMQKLFFSDAAEVAEVGGKNEAANARVHVATYQTLGIEGESSDPSFLLRHYPEDYFTHIVIDECHRSAWGKWSLVLQRNKKAVQVGLTATPRRLCCTEDNPEVRNDERITSDNIAHFGEPAYEYTLAQGMEDGYLAACEIRLAQVNLDATGLTLGDIVSRNPRNAITGQPLRASDIAANYVREKFEATLLLPDRVRAMCADLFAQLVESDKVNGPHQKTVIFCARDRHADDVATAINNLYASWCANKGIARRDPFAFKCTDAGDGNERIPDFRGSSSSHFIATTVDLLSTGVDVKPIRNIVFFRYMQSPITFYQMIGRGTRVDDVAGKLMFTVYDYTGATRLFGEDFVTEPPRESGGAATGPPPPPPPPPVIVDGFEVHVNPLERYVVGQVDGQAMPIPIEDYRAGLSRKLVEECPTLEAFRARWVDPPDRQEIINAIVGAGFSPSVLRMLEEMDDYDLFDVLADLGYGLEPRTREDRAMAFSYKQAAWLANLPMPTQATVRAIAAQFALGGTEGLENPHIWQTPEVARAGGIAALRRAGDPKELLRETKVRMFAA